MILRAGDERPPERRRLPVDEAVGLVARRRKDERCACIEKVKCSVVDLGVKGDVAREPVIAERRRVDAHEVERRHRRTDLLPALDDAGERAERLGKPLPPLSAADEQEPRRVHGRRGRAAAGGERRRVEREADHGMVGIRRQPVVPLDARPVAGRVGDGRGSAPRGPRLQPVRGAKVEKVARAVGDGQRVDGGRAVAHHQRRGVAAQQRARRVPVGRLDHRERPHAMLGKQRSPEIERRDEMPGAPRGACANAAAPCAGGAQPITASPSNSVRVPPGAEPSKTVTSQPTSWSDFAISYAARPRPEGIGGKSTVRRAQRNEKVSGRVRRDARR